MDTTARRATHAYADHKNFLAPGTVVDYIPTWCTDQFKQVKDCKTHGHWVAAWWGRALTQLAAQGHNKQQTLSFAELLTEFLNMNQLAVEMNTQVAWEYDRELWTATGDRIRGHDVFDVKKAFVEEDENAKTRIQRAVHDAKGEAKEAAREAKQAAASSNPYGKGKGGKGGKQWQQKPQYTPTNQYNKQVKKEDKPKGKGKWAKVKQERAQNAQNERGSERSQK